MALMLNMKKTYKFICYELRDSDEFAVIDKEITYPNCYVTVKKIEGDKNSIDVIVVFYDTSRKAKQLMSNKYTFCPSLNGENLIAQAYAYLKTLPEFAGAEDC